jgi:hypothetical protein
MVCASHADTSISVIAFWEFRDDIAAPVIPVVTLADQSPRFADPSGSYRLPRILPGQ